MLAAMARRRGNPVSDFIDTAGAWLGGTRNIQSPAVTRGRQAVQQTLGALDQAAGGFGRAAVNDARRLASGSGYVPSQTIKTAATNTAAAAAGYGAAKVAGKAIAQAKPYREVTKNLSKTDGFIRGEATAEQLMRLRSGDVISETVLAGGKTRSVPSISKSKNHLSKIREQNLDPQVYSDRTQMYSDDDLSRFNNLKEDIASRGVKDPVMVGRFNNKPVLLEGNHRVVAQYDVNPKAKIPYEISNTTWNVNNKISKQALKEAKKASKKR